MKQAWRYVYNLYLYFFGQNLETWLNLTAKGTEKCSSSLSIVGI